MGCGQRPASPRCGINALTARTTTRLRRPFLAPTSHGLAMLEWGMKVSARIGVWMCAVFALFCFGFAYSGFAALDTLADEAERRTLPRLCLVLVVSVRGGGSFWRIVLDDQQRKVRRSGIAPALGCIIELRARRDHAALGSGIRRFRGGPLAMAHVLACSARARDLKIPDVTGDFWRGTIDHRSAFGHSRQYRCFGSVFGARPRARSRAVCLSRRLCRLGGRPAERGRDCGALLRSGCRRGQRQSR